MSESNQDHPGSSPTDTGLDQRLSAFGSMLATPSDHLPSRVRAAVRLKRRTRQAMHVVAFAALMLSAGVTWLATRAPEVRIHSVGPGPVVIHPLHNTHSSQSGNTRNVSLLAIRRAGDDPATLPAFEQTAGHSDSQADSTRALSPRTLARTERW